MILNLKLTSPEDDELLKDVYSIGMLFNRLIFEALFLTEQCWSNMDRILRQKAHIFLTFVWFAISA